MMRRRGHIGRLVSRVGSRLGNWNDRVNHGFHADSVWECRRPRLWRCLDGIADWLYTKGDA
jgi:hypothetical protein